MPESAVRNAPATQRLSPSYRLFLSLIVGMGLLITLLLLAAANEFEELESDIARERGKAELARLKAEWQRNPDYRPPEVPGLRIWVDTPVSNLPEPLRALKPGFRDEIEQDGRSYSVTVADADGHRIIIESESEEIEDAEEEIGAFLQGSWIVLMIAIIALSWLIIRHLIRPVARFAEQIDRIDPSDRGITLDIGSSSPEIERMARAFNRYQQKMDEYVERQHAFAAMASHELRSPLTVVQTSAELIDSLADQPALRQQSRQILRASSHMEAMIRALLAITRDRPPEDTADDVALRALIEEQLAYRQREIDRHGIGIHWSLDASVRVRAPGELLSVVISNLLDNAIRHSNGSTVDILWEDGRLCIRDRGPGIDETALEDLFERGVSRGSRAGYGLGLYIVRLICERMGWRLELDNANPGTLACLQISS